MKLKPSEKYPATEYLNKNAHAIIGEKKHKIPKKI